MTTITRDLGLGAYDAWSEPERQAFLLRELQGRRPLIPADLAASADVREVLETFRTAARLPAESLGAYIISMATRPSDVLAVELLQKEAASGAPLRVVPLFETIDDLRHAAGILRELLDAAVVSPPLGRAAGSDDRLLGLGEGRGRLAANWELYQAQEQVVQACRESGIEVTLFHGRGEASAGEEGRRTWPSSPSRLARSADVCA